MWSIITLDEFIVYEEEDLEEFSEHGLDVSLLKDVSEFNFFFKLSILFLSDF